MVGSDNIPSVGSNTDTRGSLVSTHTSGCVLYGHTQKVRLITGQASVGIKNPHMWRWPCWKQFSGLLKEAQHGKRKKKKKGSEWRLKWWQQFDGRGKWNHVSPHLLSWPRPRHPAIWRRLPCYRWRPARPSARAAAILRRWEDSLEGGEGKINAVIGLGGNSMLWASTVNLKYCKDSSSPFIKYFQACNIALEGEEEKRLRRWRWRWWWGQ